MTKNTASQARVGQDVGRPRRASSTTTPNAEAKNRIPGTSRTDVGCHSVIRDVTSGLTDRATA